MNDVVEETEYNGDNRRKVGKIAEVMGKDLFFRRLILVWSISAVTWVLYLISWVVFLTFTNPPDIPSGTADALGVVAGLLTAVIATLTISIGLYKWTRSKATKK